MSEAIRKRPILSRIGICALNLLLPGLGLVRLAHYRQASAFFMFTAAFTVALIGGYFLMETLSFKEWAALVGAVFAVLLAALLGSVAVTWRASPIVEPRAGMAWRWFGVLAIWAVSVLVAWPLPDIAHARFHGFYIPSVAMAPTLQVNDRLIADMHAIDPISRGDVVIARVNGIDYVKRVAARPGDKVALVSGQIILNGRPVAQRFVERTRVQDDWGVQKATVSREQFPGERKAHLVMDTGSSPVDNFSEVTLPAGRYLLLGDNRDHSADSRLPPGPEMGLGLVPRNAITGRVAFRYWRDGVGIGPGRDQSLR